MYYYLDLFIIYAASLLTFVLFAWDKHLAVYQKSRIPEFVLLLFSFLGGVFGALCAMVFFRHKTLHKTFLVCVPVFLIILLIADILYRVFVLRLA